MARRARSMAPKPDWARLPKEIQHIIIGYVAGYAYPPKRGVHYSVGGDDSSPSPFSPGLAAFASVCKEWQQYFEQYTFHRLQLDWLSAVDGNFRSMVEGRNCIRMSYIAKIELYIVLAPYECNVCKEDESEQEIRLYV